MKKELKKGNSSWKPANVVDLYDKEDGFRYRRIEKSPQNIQKKKQEGWEILSSLSSDKTTAESGYGRMDDGKPLTSVLEGYDYVIGRIPEDVAVERDKYMNERTEKSTNALVKKTKEDFNGSAPTHGGIEMTKGRVTNIIKD